MAMRLGQSYELMQNSLMDLKSFTKHLIDVSTPQMLKDLIKALGNKLEEQEQNIQAQQQKINQLEAEIRKLKGLPGKPRFPDKTSELEGKEHNNDEAEKKPNPGKGKARRKKQDLVIDLTKQCEVSSDDLDATYEYKGKRRVIVQDILFQRNNICFELEKYYSSKHKKTVEGNLPPGYEGGYFGPNIIAFILCSYYEGDVTIKKIWKILDAIGIKISLKQINRIINHRPDELLDEMDQARIAGIEKAGYQQIDDTGARIGSPAETGFSIVVSNPYFTNIVTGFFKSRFAAVMALAGGHKAPLYKMNDQAVFVFFKSQGPSSKVELLMGRYNGEKVYTEDELGKLFKEDGFVELSFHILRQIKTAMLVGAYYDGHLGITGKALVSDDARQFSNLFDTQILCWYHEFRHYKEIIPILNNHQTLMREFFDEAKLLYQALKAWTLGGRRMDAKVYLIKWFTDFFTKETGFTLLDDRKRMSFAKIDKLLAPLFVDFIVPLQNNESERDIRGRVIKNKISLVNRTFEGARAWDLHLSIKQTCRKLRVNYWKFLLDRITGSGQIPKLCEIIQAA